MAAVAAAFAKSLTAVFPVSLRLDKSLFAALSIAARVALFKPNVTKPSVPVVIASPAFGTSVSVAVSDAAVKLNPLLSATVGALASSAPFARYLIGVFPNCVLSTLLASAVLTVPAVTNLPASPLADKLVAIFGVIVTAPFASTVDTVNAVVLPLVIDFTPTFALIFTVPALFSRVILSPASRTTRFFVSPVTVFAVTSVAFASPAFLICNNHSLACTAFNCFTLTASKSLVPPATLIIRRVIFLPPVVLPIDTTPLPLLFTVSPVK